MSKHFALAIGLVTVLGLAVGSVSPVTAQTCEPLNNGRIADVFYEGTVIFWQPVVEYRQMVLTISGPCEDITKTFDPEDEISFDIREIKRVTDGQYTWELRRVSPIDEGAQQELIAARGSGEEDALWWNYFQKGIIPEGPYVDSESFVVVGGEIIDPKQGGEKTTSATTNEAVALAGAGFAAAGGEGNQIATKQTIAQSLCVGFDCASSPSFSDSTILLTENNTRIKFDDTSTVGSYPRNDWELQANSSANGGGAFFAINDCGDTNQGGCADDPLLIVEAGAPSNSIRVDSGGRVGFGTANPVVELHSVSGDSPTLRLAQDTSSGFAAQTWDVAGNETSFFVRDATNGSTLPFRIRPGASSNSLVIDTDSDVGVGTLSPADKLHVLNGALRVEASSTSGDPRIHVLSDQAQTGASGQPGFKFENTSSGQTWDFRIGGAGNLILNSNAGGVEFTFATNGDFSASGTKSFAVLDPENSDKKIYYAALEGPEAGTYFRGTAETVDGEAVIDLPEFFSKVTEKEGLTVQLTPVGGWHQLYLVEKTPDRLVVRDATGEGAVEFDFFVQGVRSGYADFQVERPALD